MTEEIKEILDTPIFMIDNDGFTVYINDKINNYITNLQKENDNLKNVMFTGRNYNEVLKSEQDYKSRNKKAIEKIVIKQARLINEKDYVITDLDLDEIMRTLESGE